MQFKKEILCTIFLSSFLCTGHTFLLAQTQDSSASRVYIQHSDKYSFVIHEDDQKEEFLSGNVQLRQNFTFLFCDSAFISNNQVKAYGNTSILEGDTLRIFGDALQYDGNTRLANLIGHAYMENQDKKLTTHQLSYDLNKKLVYYTTPAYLQEGTMTIYSRRGYYYTNSKDIFFKDSVQVEDQDFSLKTDTLKFNLTSRLATFLAPTLIKRPKEKIYCESGYYDIPGGIASFQKNAQYLQGDRRTSGDTINYNKNSGDVIILGNAFFNEKDREAKGSQITYNEKTELFTLLGSPAFFQDKERTMVSPQIIYNAKTKSYSTQGRSDILEGNQRISGDQLTFDDVIGVGYVKGNVYWQDSVQKLYVYCDSAIFIKEGNQLTTLGKRPLLINGGNAGDSLFCSADTLMTKRIIQEGDTTRMLYGKGNARIWQQNFSALCDSMQYNEKDSLFTLFNKPIAWSDTTQFTSELMRIKFENHQADSMFLDQNAMIINTTDQKYFNQIRGRNIVSEFSNNKMHQMWVMGNAETVYYALDDNQLYIGVNKSVCSNMKLDFQDNKIHDIRFFTNPESSFNPMDQVDHEKFRLGGFRWEFKMKPKGPKDVFSDFVL